MPSQARVLQCASFHPKEEHGSPSSLPAWGSGACGEVSSKVEPHNELGNGSLSLSHWAVGGQDSGSGWPEVPLSERVGVCGQGHLGS